MLHLTEAQCRRIINRIDRLISDLQLVSSKDTLFQRQTKEETLNDLLKIKADCLDKHKSL